MIRLSVWRTESPPAPTSAENPSQIQTEPDQIRVQRTASMISESSHPFDAMRQTIANAYDAQGLGQEDVELDLFDGAPARPSLRYSLDHTYFSMLWTTPLYVSLSFIVVILLAILVAPHAMPDLVTDVPKTSPLNDVAASSLKNSLSSTNSLGDAIHTATTSNELQAEMAPTATVSAAVFLSMSGLPALEQATCFPKTDFPTASAPNVPKSSYISFPIHALILPSSRQVLIKISTCSDRYEADCVCRPTKDVSLIVMRNDSPIKGTLRDDSRYEGVLLELPEKDAHGVLTFILIAYNKPLVDAKFVLDFGSSSILVEVLGENEQVAFKSVPASPLEHSLPVGIPFKWMPGVLPATQFAALGWLIIMAIECKQDSDMPNNIIIFHMTFTSCLLMFLMTTPVAIRTTRFGYVLHLALCLVEFFIGVWSSLMLVAGIQGFLQSPPYSPWVTNVPFIYGITYWIICFTGPSALF